MKFNKQSGQVLVGVAIAMVVLAGFAGLAIDMGTLRYQKRLQQSAADGAAMAGADEIRYSGGSGVTGAAKNAATQNGFTDSAGNVSNCAATGAAVGTICVQVLNAPADVTLPDGTVIPGGPHTGNNKYVEVLVGEVQPTYFMQIFGVNSKLVVARAVATQIGESGNGAGCVYTLGPPGTGVGVTTNGTPSVQAPTCGFEDNGNFTTNGSKLDINAGSIGVVGTDKNNGGGTVTCAQTPNNCPVGGMAPAGDPLSYLTPPCSPCTGGTALNISSSQTVSPGTYSSISITGGTVDFLPGTYIITGNFTVNGNGTVCSSVNTDCSGMTPAPNAPCGSASAPPPSSANAGVTFYITNGGSVTINGTSTVQLTAPNTGPYAGVLFYQDPNDTSLAKLNGTNTSFYQGALYFPSAELDFGGTNFSNGGAAYTLVVSNDLKFNGTSTVCLNSNYSSLPGGTSIIENAVLVE